MLILQESAGPRSGLPEAVKALVEAAMSGGFAISIAQLQEMVADEIRLRQLHEASDGLLSENARTHFSTSDERGTVAHTYGHTATGHGVSPYSIVHKSERAASLRRTIADIEARIKQQHEHLNNPAQHHEPHASDHEAYRNHLQAKAKAGAARNLLPKWESELAHYKQELRAIGG